MPEIENDINNFIEVNNIEVIDIKYTSSCAADGMSAGKFWIASALVLYRQLQ
ncbi:MAG: sporulation protein Cse60 [Muribaculaceae bacterium]